MIRDDAEKLVARLQEAFGSETTDGTAVVATVAPSAKRVEFAAPGGGRPHIIRYSIRIADSAQESFLDLDQAEAFLDDVAPGWGPDRIFEEISTRGMVVQPIQAAGTNEDPYHQDGGDADAEREGAGVPREDPPA